ncbi:hypothetical protein [Pontibacter sp. H249]|uniref:hypothetical protein n=1 Tax=Pontibacter sp. H249 TaxID=3133420 RepID=UPI0030C21609
MKKVYRWVMRNKWRKWGTIALLCVAINYTLLIAGVIEANEFEVITTAIVTVIRLFIGI